MEIIVYALADPRDKSIRYVGQTSNLKVRLFGHASAVYRPSRNNQWTMSLVDLGLRPIAIILERCENRQDAREKEKYWIKKLIAEGHDLNNVEASRVKPPIIVEGLEAFQELVVKPPAPGE